MSSTNDPSTTSSPTPDPAGEQETPGTRRHRLARRWLEHQL